MSIRYWLYALALGGCLISGPLCAQEQDSSASLSPQAEEQPNGKADDHPATPEPLALPVRIIQSDEEAAHERERNRNSDKHEAAGLKAQERSANAAERNAASAERLEELALTQIGIAGTGTLGLIIALILSYCSNRTAVKALNLARENTQIELRAYVSFAPVGITYDSPNNRLLIAIAHQNTGQTPARKVQKSILFESFPYPLPIGTTLPDPDFGNDIATLPTGAGITTNPPFNGIERQDDIDAMLSPPSVRIYAICVASYEDVFGKKHRTRTCWSYNPKGINLKRAMENGSISVPIEFTDQHNDEC